MPKSAISKFSLRNSWQAILAVLMLLLAFVFFRNERHELSAIIPQLKNSDGWWILAGFAASVLYIVLQSAMYIASFRSTGLRLSFSDAVELFLKRNFLSVFLPIGGVSSLAYLPASLKRRQFETAKVHQASAVYGYVGLLTVLLVGIPVVFYTLINRQSFGNSWIWLIVLAAILGVAFWGAFSFRNKGFLYGLINKKRPDFAERINSLFAGNFNKKWVYITIFYSTLIEFCCILIVYVGMLAIGVHSLEAAAVGYIISVIFMSVSPFLRGLGAVEFSLVVVLRQYGFTNAEGLSITMLYRVFEFWLPLALGVAAYVWRGKQILVRIVPAVFIFALGIVNILSASTLPIAERWKDMLFYLPAEALHISNLMTLTLGIALIFTSVYLIRGFRTAWILGVVFSIFSVLGHIGKGLDYEEAAFGIIALILLILSRKQYVIKSSQKWMRLGFRTFLMVLATVCVFDFLAFYFIDKHHFAIDFTWQQSLYHTARSFLFFFDNELIPQSRFGTELLYTVRFLGFFSWLMLFFTLLQPAIFRHDTELETVDATEELLKKFGNSANDYFKIQPDKKLWFSSNHQAFASFRTANNFAVVLEEPVCDADEKLEVIKEFEAFCRSQNLKPVYYRIAEQSLFLFKSMGRKSIKIGQEAVVDAAHFTLEGRDHKSLRNAMNSLQKNGYKVSTYLPPHSDDFINELKSVSDEWLGKFDKKEMVFSQGVFDAETIKDQPVIAVTDNENSIDSFLNIIPTYGSGECTYDLIRRTENSPGGCMDAMIIQLIDYAKTNGFSSVNMGLAPLSGMEKPDNTAEQIMRFASQKIGSLKHFQSLHFFKEKYAGQWENKYLVFDNDFDLLQIPAVLAKVMKP